MNEKRIKLFASLAHSKFRKAHRLFLVEGIHAVMGLLESEWPMETIIMTDSFDQTGFPKRAKQISPEIAGRKVIDRIATTETPQEIIAVARIPDTDLKDALSRDRIVIADGVKDPGNMGTIIRTAEALGFESVITTAGAVDIFNPKVVRATQGSMFFMHIAQRLGASDLLKRLKGEHTLYALTSDGDIDLTGVRIDDKAALITGSEIGGISNELLSAADFKVRIPIKGRSESLNSAIAAGIAMYFLGRR